MAEAGFAVRPYHVSVPSFGEWGFMLARPVPFDPPARILPGLRSLSDAVHSGLFVFSPDLSRVETETNRLDTQALVHYYEAEWRRLE